MRVPNLAKTQKLINVLKATKMVGNSVEGSLREDEISNITYHQLNFDRERGKSCRTTNLNIRINMRLHVPMSRVGKGEMNKTLSKSI